MVTKGMTEQQRRIFRRICAGQNADEIAAAEGIPPTEVYSARAQILLPYPIGTTLTDLCLEAAPADLEDSETD